MTTTFLSSPPHLLNSAALWHPSGQNTSSTPQLHCSLVPPMDKILPHLLLSSTPHLLNSIALWHPQWTKYLLTFSIPPLSGAPSGQNTYSSSQLRSSRAPQVAPTMLFGAPGGQNTSSPPPSPPHKHQPNRSLYTTNNYHTSFTIILIITM